MIILFNSYLIYIFQSKNLYEKFSNSKNIKMHVKKCLSVLKNVIISLNYIYKNVANCVKTKFNNIVDFVKQTYNYIIIAGKYIRMEANNCLAFSEDIEINKEIKNTISCFGKVSFWSNLDK